MQRTAIAVTVAGVAALAVIALIVTAALFSTSDRDRLDQAWGEISSDDRAAICAGYLIVPDFTASELVTQTEVDRDTARDFLDDVCGSAA